MASIRPTEWKRTSADCREERERRREWQAGALCVCAANTGDSPKWSSRQLHVCCDKWLLPLFCATGTKPRALEESASDLNIAQRAHAAARLLKFQGSDVSRDSVRRSRQRKWFFVYATPPCGGVATYLQNPAAWSTAWTRACIRVLNFFFGAANFPQLRGSPQQHVVACCFAISRPRCTSATPTRLPSLSRALRCEKRDLGIRHVECRDQNINRVASTHVTQVLMLHIQLVHVRVTR